MGLQRIGAFVTLLLVSMALCQSTPTPASDADMASLKAVSSSVNRFALSLLKTACEERGPGENVLVSPLSASLATAMVYQGALAATRSEIQAGLSFPADDQQFEKGFTLLNDNLNKENKNVTLEVANRVYIDKTLKIKDSFKNALINIHKSSLAPADFKASPEPARLEINKWVENKTHDKIKDLLKEGTIDSSTAMVLVNALYFKGLWKDKFKAEDTEIAPFHLTKDKEVNVSMMYRTGNMEYAEVPELNAKVLSLPYEGDKVKMVIVLPDEIDGLSGVITKLTTGVVDLDNVHFYRPEVRLWLPKFTLEDTHDLKAIYQKMGISKMFTDEADFSGAVEPPNKLSVSAAVQKTFMEVNEEGTEAAAATGIEVEADSLVEGEVFTSDRPFLVFIRGLHDSSSTSYFLGVVKKPQN